MPNLQFTSFVEALRDQVLVSYHLDLFDLHIVRKSYFSCTSTSASKKMSSKELLLSFKENVREGLTVTATYDPFLLFNITDLARFLLLAVLSLSWLLSAVGKYSIYKAIKQVYKRIKYDVHNFCKVTHTCCYFS